MMVKQIKSRLKELINMNNKIKDKHLKKNLGNIVV